MNQEKIGKFISSLRKENNMTQLELAEKLNISDRAVSKWERGINLPDASLMLELSKMFNVTINELLNGEIIKDNYMEKAEEKLLELKARNDEYAKKMLNLEYVIGFSASITFITLIYVASYIEMETLVRILLIALGLIIFVVGVIYSLKIEQEAGYYECGKCHHKYIPTYKSVLFSMHMGRTRKMKCPKCGEKSWNKKVLTK